ncbi:MAG TPA: DUF2510 domain-containing protein [Miltoncostaeaceae bacterium]|nr:DUF2510 domain-containing protein [Miltoncostaeaceae bacterium]
MTPFVPGLTQQPPASWYREAGNPGVLRWWDGRRWTEHRAPDPAFATRPAPVVSRSRRMDGALLGAGATGVVAAALALAALKLPLVAGGAGAPAVDIWTLRTAGSTPGDLWKSVLLGAAIAAAAGLLCCLAAGRRGSPLGRRAGAWGLVVAAFPLAWTAVMAGTEISEIPRPPGAQIGWGAALHLSVLAAALSAGAGVLALTRERRAYR